MKTIQIGILACTVLSMMACSTQKSTQKNKSMTNKEKGVAVIESIGTGAQEPVAYINAQNYTQHNLAVADGLAGFGEVLSHAPEGGFESEVVRAFEDEDYVFMHVKYDFFGPKAAFDIFRFEDGKIVEHWDNLTPVAPANPSGHTQFDGSTEIKDLDKTEVNKTLVRNFFTDVLMNGKMDQLPNYFDGDSYIQHNTQIADGLSGLGQALEYMAAQGITMKFDKIHKVLGEGNFVLVVSEGEFAGKPTSFYDLFRVENGKIAEHWDVIEPILPEAERKNQNGKFNY